MSSLSNLTNHFKEDALLLAEQVVENVLNKLQLTISTEEHNTAISMYMTFMSFIGDTLESGEKGVPTALIEWSKLNAEAIVVAEGNISDIIVRYPPTREVFAELVEELSSQFELSLRDSLYVFTRINEMLDISLDETVIAYERLTEKYKKDMQKEVDELSSPIVPVREGIAVLPLMGKIDSNRADYLLEKVVPKVQQLNLDYLIVDFSGISTMDELTAHHIHQIGSVLRLLGIDLITTGINPTLALTSVKGGLDMENVKAYSSVKQALETI
ncbi:STAS domain-containing protein [Alkalihalophilus sp. As8PL]|uniref:STAS domain-containing protein n=1 Tax=Alkalihalophilus sp. As8PL TaxID=3237103 RepID=A0AB39BUD5_9BACI